MVPTASCSKCALSGRDVISCDIVGLVVHVVCEQWCIWCGIVLSERIYPAGH
jgi:hypothetical protein